MEHDPEKEPGVLQIADRGRWGMRSREKEVTKVPTDDEFPGTEAVRGLFDLSGKAAIVTGAASGLGRQISLGLASFGADVAVADINFPGAEETAKKIREIDRRAMAIKVDVVNWSEVSEMDDKARDEFGKIDICFNIPGLDSEKFSVWLGAC